MGKVGIKVETKSDNLGQKTLIFRPCLKFNRNFIKNHASIDFFRFLPVIV